MTGSPGSRLARSRSPLAGLRELDRPTLYVLGLLSALKAAALIGLAGALSDGIVGVIHGGVIHHGVSQPGVDWPAVLAIGAGSAIVRAIVTWAHRVVSARALLGTKEKLRAELAERLVGVDGRSAGSATTLATQGLDELDKYITVFLPALVNAATIPLLVGARILAADWVSAVVIVLTVPLIPVFMALIGLHTNERVAAAGDALSRLSDHLVELASGLPVLVGLGRATEQAAALRVVSDGYRRKTVQTLRTAFLSSLALELIATISVAIVAVFIGVRLVAGDLTLDIGLFVLLLAPECFTPLRDIGAAFHAAEDGREALSRTRAILDAPIPASIVTAGGPLAVDNLTVSFANRSAPSVDGLSFRPAERGITVLDGRSGAGKSSVLAVLAGRLTAGDDVSVSGSVTGVPAGGVAWLPQHPRFMDGTVREEAMLYAGDATDAGALVDRALEQLGLGHLAQVDTAILSPGELRRLAFARVLLRVAAGATIVLLDEPTAQLDDGNAVRVVSAIASLRGRATVIVASHDELVRSRADLVVALDDVVPASPAASAEPDALPLTAPRNPSGAAQQASAARAVSRFFRPVGGRLVLAIQLGVFATLFAVSLTGVSGWLIVRASQQPPILYLLVAIVSVRFFGIGRAVLRYSERLMSHNAVLTAATELRMRLWAALASRGVRSRALLASGRTLDHLVRDVDQLRDLAIRVVLPALVGAATMIVGVGALWLIYPPAAPLFVALGLVALIGAPAVALLADRSAARAEFGLRSTVVRRFAAMLGAAADLRANGVDGSVRASVRAIDLAAGRQARRGAWALGLGSAVVAAACGLTSVLVLPVTAAAVGRGELAPELVAVLMLTPLALIDSLVEFVVAIQNLPRLRGVARRVDGILDTTPVSGGSAVPPERVERITLHEVTASWADDSMPVFSGLSAEAASGDWLVVTGASGSGKSTMLAVLLGQLPIAGGRYLVNGRDASDFDAGLLAGQFGWCPQEGHLFDSSLRANLLIARSKDRAPDERELLETLRRVGLGPLLARLPAGLDTQIGAGGRWLSGGERQRIAVARTLLTGAPVILIDEPTAHLDAESAESLMADLRVALADRITVLVTHQAVGVRPDDRRIDLDRLRQGHPTASAESAQLDSLRGDSQPADSVLTVSGAA